MQELFNEKPTLFDLLRSPLFFHQLEELVRMGADSITNLMFNYNLVREFNIMEGPKMDRYQVLAKKYNKSMDVIRKGITKMIK